MSAVSPPTTDPGGAVYVATVDGAIHRTDTAGSTPVQVTAGQLGSAGRSYAAQPMGDRALALVDDSGRLQVLRDGLAWTGFHGSPEHRGAQIQMPVLTGVVDWSVDVGGTIELSPVLNALDETAVHTTEGDLVVVDAGGNIRFRLAVGAGPGLPLFHPQGMWLTASTSGVLSAFGQDGTSLWFRNLGGGLSGLNVLADGSILVASPGLLHCIGADGTSRWARGFGGTSESAAAVGRDGFIRMGAADATLSQWDESGNLHWSTGLPGSVRRSSPMVDTTGATYVVTDQEVLVAVAADGSVNWSFDPGVGSSAGGRAAPALLANGTVVYGAVDGFLYALRADGTLLFAHDAGAAVRSAPVVDGEGNITFGTDAGVLHSLTSLGAVRFALPLALVPFPLSSAAVSSDGSLLVGDRAGTLFRVR